MEYEKTRSKNSPRKVHLSLPTADDLEVISDLEGEVTPHTSSGKCTGDRLSESSISTSILDEDLDPKALKSKLQDMELRCRMLEVENEKINAELSDEKSHVSKLERKLQFVKDNQEVFMRLKEAYINMKYNEAAGRKMIEIREKGIQTWEGILCKSCIETEEVRRNMNILMERYKELFVLSTSEMDQLVNTAKYLKDLVDRREKSWLSNIERENKLHQNVAILERENETLRKVLKERQALIKDLSVMDPKKNNDNEEQLRTEIAQLKKIVVKFEKRFRDSLEINPYAKTSSPLNEKEQKAVVHLMSKYRLKLQRKSSERSRSLSSQRSKRLERPRSALKSRQKSERALDSPSSPCTRKLDNDISRQAENALKMIDCLFDN